MVFHQLGITLKELNAECRYALESFPVVVCDNIFIACSRLVCEAHYRGYVASKRRSIYGIRVQMMVTVGGVPIEFRILPASLSEVAELAHLPLSLPAGAEVAADASYTYYE